MDLTAHCQPVEGVLSQAMGDTRVLLNVSDGQYYALNEVGSLVWDLCDGRRSIAEVVAEVSAQYDGDPADVRADVLQLAEELMSAGLLSVTH